MYCSSFLTSLWRHKFLSDQAVFIHDQKVKTKTYKYLENEKSFWDERNIFRHFWRAIIEENNIFFGRWESDFNTVHMSCLPKICCECSFSCLLVLKSSIAPISQQWRDFKKARMGCIINCSTLDKNLARKCFINQNCTSDHCPLQTWSRSTSLINAKNVSEIKN